MESNLMIKDLSVSKELDEQELSAVRGGSSNVFGNVNTAAAMGGNGIGNTATAVNVAPITSVDASSHVDLAALSNIGGFMLAQVR